MSSMGHVFGSQSSSFHVRFLRWSLGWSSYLQESSYSKVKRKWHSWEERKIDQEYDVVIVQFDGGCVSGSESDNSDWSIGWLEPHGPEFQSDDEVDNSFAVLVPCYGRGLQEMVTDIQLKAT
ncbi:hypothetical protein G4B88_011246 [Cannabis sativa]|uniref:Uncharacterized protein n=1 Tax=Cannabis sativa TaxID=3483 RepID=A0A7J6GBJ5_CANSA|nr:hypothetical protein G4B88_011246 [Cannabis sativa]